MTTWSGISLEVAISHLVHSRAAGRRTLASGEVRRLGPRGGEALGGWRWVGGRMYSWVRVGCCL